MKKLIILTLAIMVLISCDENDDNSNLKTISTIDNFDLFDKTVILYEDNEYLISTYFDKYISTYPFDVLFGYDELKQKAIQDTVVFDTLFMENYLDLKGRYLYVVAHHLENGSCLIFDKKSQVIIKSIQMEKWSEGGSMSTYAGRRFYIKKKLLLKTVDLLS